MTAPTIDPFAAGVARGLEILAAHPIPEDVARRLGLLIRPERKTAA